MVHGEIQFAAIRYQSRHLRRTRRRSFVQRVLQEIGLNYVSCSPYCIPVARLAAAQAALRQSKPAKKK